jgi:hypothetical protein
MSVRDWRFETIGDETLDEWDALAQSSPHATFYHSADWFRALREIEPRARLIGCFRLDRLIGGCPVLDRTSFGFREALKPWATFYNGPIFSSILLPEDGDAALHALLSHLRATYDAVRLVFPPHSCSESPPQEAPWKIARDYSYLVDAADAGGLWRRLNRRARQRVRKATRLGIHCEPLENGQIFFRLYRATYARQRLPFHITEEAFGRFWSEIGRSKNAKAFVAKTENGMPAAALLVSWHRQRSYFVLAASDTKLRKTDATTLLWWETFKWCSTLPAGEAGRRSEIDLVGHATPGIDRFKRSFSPAELPFHVLTCAPRGAQRIKHDLSHFLRRLAR